MITLFIGVRQISLHHSIYSELESSKKRRFNELNVIIENLHKNKDLFEKYYVMESIKYPDKMNTQIINYREYLLSVVEHTQVVKELQKFYLQNVFQQVLSTIKIIKTLKKLDYQTKICQANLGKVNH